MLVILAAAAGGIYAWWRRRNGRLDWSIKRGDKTVMESLDEFRENNQKKHHQIHQRMDKLGEKMNHQGNRLTKLEQKVENLPSQKDLQQINSQLARLEAATAETSAKVSAQNELLQTINTFLIQREERK